MDEKAIDWRGASYEDLSDMPEKLRRTFSFALGLAQNGLPYQGAETRSAFEGAGVIMVRELV
jgi:phage-related protein